MATALKNTFTKPMPTGPDGEAATALPSVMTPRGLRLNLEVHEVFSVLARLWQKDPKTDAFRVLKTCEAIYAVPAVLGFIAGLIAVFYPGCPRWAIAVSIAGAWFVGQVLVAFGLFSIIRPTGLLLAGLIWSYIPFRTLGQLAMLVFFLIKFGWVVPVLWIVGVVVGTGCAGVIENRLALWGMKKFGTPCTMAEWCFIYAYQVHAVRLGVTREIALEPEDVEEPGWEACLEDYVRKYPSSAARCRLGVYIPIIEARRKRRAI